MTNKDRLQTWVEARKWENDDGTWQIYDPSTGFYGGLSVLALEPKIFQTEEQIDKVLWKRAMKLDTAELYGVDI